MKFSFEFFKKQEPLFVDRAVEKLADNERVAAAVNELLRLTFGGSRVLDDQRLRTEAAAALLREIKAAGVELVPEGAAAEATDALDRVYYVAMQFADAYREYQSASNTEAV
jgi:hypothetical protein